MMPSLRSRGQNPDAVIECIRNIDGSGRVHRYTEWITETSCLGIAAVAAELRDTGTGQTSDRLGLPVPHPNQVAV